MRPAFDAHRRERRGVGNRQAAQAHRVEELENRGVGTDAEGQGEHRGEREAPALAQGAQREADILQQILGAPLIALPVCSAVTVRVSLPLVAVAVCCRALARLGTLTARVRIWVERVANLLGHPCACPNLGPEGCRGVLSHIT